MVIYTHDQLYCTFQGLELKQLKVSWINTPGIYPRVDLFLAAIGSRVGGGWKESEDYEILPR